MPETALKGDSRRSKIVMGVDDAPASLAILDALVTRAGYTFIGVNSGMDCLRVIARSQPKLLLLDIEMPGIDGIEVCRRIRAQNVYDKIPIAFLTAKKPDKQLLRELVVAGGNDFIIKPFDTVTLLERISHWTMRPATQADRFKKALALG